MLVRFEEECKGGLKIHGARDRTEHVAYITLVGGLRLGEETAALRQLFDRTLRHGCQDVVLNLENLREISPAGLGQLILLKDIARMRGILAHVSQFPAQADLWVIIALCATYGVGSKVG